MEIVTSINDVLWGYILIALLLGCGLWFTLRMRFVQFRMIPEMFKLLADFGGAPGKPGEKHISSFQAFAISLASRVGTGNLAGVATAITVGGPGAVFWMWMVALLGAASSFVESTLAQLYKKRGDDCFYGGPAYYIRQGLKMPAFGALVAILIILTFSFGFVSVQSNTICAAFEGAFGWSHTGVGIAITLITLLIIFGGVHRIAKFSSVVVPFMAIGYVILALIVVILNIEELPAVIETIVSHAFGWKQALGGGVGVAMMQGVRRGLFSNEAGLGSAPNAAATAHVTHPVKQGLIQALGVFTDTLLICTCTAFIILFSGVPIDRSTGVVLTQEALSHEMGSMGGVFVALAMFFFAFSTIIGDYYYGESNLRYLTRSPRMMTVFRLLVGATVLYGSFASLELVWNITDLIMGLMGLSNIIAIAFLGKYAYRLLDDYCAQKKAGIKNPVFKRSSMPDIEKDIECWEG